MQEFTVRFPELSIFATTAGVAPPEYHRYPPVPAFASTLNRTTPVPEAFTMIDDVTLKDGKLTIVDRSGGTLVLAASREL